jgi:hypothetical protein
MQIEAAGPKRLSQCWRILQGVVLRTEQVNEKLEVLNSSGSRQQSLIHLRGEKREGLAGPDRREAVSSCDWDALGSQMEVWQHPKS